MCPSALRVSCALCLVSGLAKGCAYAGLKTSSFGNLKPMDIHDDFKKQPSTSSSSLSPSDSFTCLEERGFADASLTEPPKGMTLPIAPVDASRAAKRTLYTSVGKRQKLDGGAGAATTRPKKYGLIDLQATLYKLHPKHVVVDPVDHTPLTAITWPNYTVHDKPTIVCGFDGTVCSTLSLAHIVCQNKGISCPTCREAKKVSWTQVAPFIHVNGDGMYSALRKSYLSAATEYRSDFKSKEDAIQFKNENAVVQGWYRFDDSIATNGKEFFVLVQLNRNGVKVDGVRKRVATKEEAYRVRDEALATSVRYGSHHLKDERTAPYAGDDAIQLLPASQICQVSTHTKREKKWVAWYEGSRFVSHDVTAMSEEEVEKLMERGRIKKNNHDDVITIAKSSITPFHVRHYRYVQPRMDYEGMPVPVEPYYLGVWLGDGSSLNTGVTTIDKAILSYLQEYATRLGLIINAPQHIKPRKTDVLEHELDVVAVYAITGGHDYGVAADPELLEWVDELLNVYPIKSIADAAGMTEGHAKLSDWFKGILTTHESVPELELRLRTLKAKPSALENRDKLSTQKNKHPRRLFLPEVRPSPVPRQKPNTLYTAMQQLNLINNKHIPDIYLKNSVDVRLAVLAGIIDTDGYLSKNAYDVIQKNKVLSHNIVELARSLGFYTTWKECRKSCMYKGERREGVYIRIRIDISPITPTVPVRLDRKRFDRSIVHNWCTPRIDARGMPLAKTDVSSEWTVEDDILLLQEVVQQSGKTIEWAKMKVPEGHGSGAKRSRFRHLRKKHDLLKMDHIQAANAAMNKIMEEYASVPAHSPRPQDDFP